MKARTTVWSSRGIVRALLRDYLFIRHFRTLRKAMVAKATRQTGKDSQAMSDK